jgi:tetratricopeptide (TPR) repeat protein
MKRLHILLLAATVTLSVPLAAQAQDPAFTNRADALQALGARDPQRRAEAIAWIAEHGMPSDDAALRSRLKDESPFVRRYAEQALWVLWSRSGDDAVDALMETGVEQMQAQQFGAAIATFSEVIRRKPSFAEGWNKRATGLFMAGELKRSLADCDEVVKRNPNHFGALAGYGQIYFQLEQYEKAIEYWKRALAVNPNMDGVQAGIKSAEALIAERRKGLGVTI